MLDILKSLPAVFRTLPIFFMLPMLLISCSSSTPPTSGGGGGDDASYTVSGVGECYLCHYPDGAIGEIPVGTEVVEKWLIGPHSNNETPTGSPAYGDADWEDSCASCHDDRGDGELLEDFSIATGIDGLGEDNRPIVGCESCHGESGDHAGSVGTISPLYPRPDPGQCGQCHYSDYEQDGAHEPEGDNIYEDYITSPHAVSINEHNYVDGSLTDVRILCSKCHTDEGAKLYKDVSGTHDELVAALPDTLAPVEDATVVQCRTCHNPHDPSELLFEESGGESAEYRTCSNCHQNDGTFGLADAYHGENNGHSWSEGPPDFTVGVAPFLPEEIIYDTHFDNAATSSVIEGYNLGPLTSGNFGLESERLCRDCHNVHAADTTINNEWARSAHSGHIAEAKEAADASDPQNILDAGVQDTAERNSPWAHYDFATFAGRSCSRCHTSSGVKNYLNNPAGYSAFSNDYSHLSPGQKEVLYCWACHTDNTGGLRDPGPITAEYTSTPFTDIAGSNICMACHSGRASGDEIKNSTDDFKSMDFVNSHYLAAGGTIFAAIGYEFIDYINPVPYPHGSSLLLDDNGPCVACHMETAESHLFLSVIKDDITDEITAISSSVCKDCHDVGLINAATLQDDSEGFHEALEFLKDELDSAGMYFSSHHPYFYTDVYDDGYTETGACKSNLPIQNWQEGGTTNYVWNAVEEDCTTDATVGVAGTADTGEDRMGAAFNFNMLHHEPGAYAHNPQYTKELIFDSIDRIDNGTLDETITIPVTYPEARSWFDADGAGVASRP